VDRSRKRSVCRAADQPRASDARRHGIQELRRAVADAVVSGALEKSATPARARRDAARVQDPVARRSASWTTARSAAAGRTLCRRTAATGRRRSAGSAGRPRSARPARPPCCGCGDEDELPLVVVGRAVVNHDRRGVLLLCTPISAPPCPGPARLLRRRAGLPCCPAACRCDRAAEIFVRDRILVLLAQELRSYSCWKSCTDAPGPIFRWYKLSARTYCCRGTPARLPSRGWRCASTTGGTARARWPSWPESPSTRPERSLRSQIVRTAWTYYPLQYPA
jgi:hypothetical protein